MATRSARPHRGSIKPSTVTGTQTTTSNHLPRYRADERTIARSKTKKQDHDRRRPGGLSRGEKSAEKLGWRQRQMVEPLPPEEYDRARGERLSRPRRSGSAEARRLTVPVDRLLPARSRGS